MKTERGRERRPSPSEEARKGGFVDGCRECMRYLATTGAAACPEHFVPVRDRTPPKEEAP